MEKIQKKYPEERILAEEKIIRTQTEEIQKAIDVIKKDEPKYDYETFPKEVTTPADFETGITGFRKLIANTFDTSTVQLQTGTSRTTLRFIIDENGIPTNAIAQGDNPEFNLEALVTFYIIKEKNYKWKPAELNGVPVKSAYIVPLVMVFE